MKHALLTTGLLIGCLAAADPLPGAEGDAAELRALVQAMKQNPRGPFARIRWFCKDGSVLPPEQFACRERGGGRQHGEWSADAQRLRAAGYRVANVYAAIDPDAFVNEEARSAAFAQMLVEQYLIRADDGWIMRQARYYRGALQEEGERRVKRQLLLRLIGDPDWLDHRVLMLRVAARLLDHGADTQTIQRIRQDSAAYSQREPAFMRLRNKIHNSPDAGDAAAVRQFAGGLRDATLAAELESLAAMIDAVYAVPLQDRIAQAAAADFGSAQVSRLLAGAVADLAGAQRPAERFRITGELLAALRDALGGLPSVSRRLQLLDLSLLIEDAHFTAAAEQAEAGAAPSRRETLAALQAGVAGLYGAGLVSGRQYDALRAEAARLSADQVSLADYRQVLRYLALPPDWATQRYRYAFGEAMDRLAAIEPMAVLFIQDQLRGSSLFGYVRLIDPLLREANRLAGVSSELFGAELGGGMRALNPGLARGTLYLGVPAELADFDPEGIYLLPETVADLPPVAGIVTLGEGNPLSHVQLLARNLGIPNVALEQRLLGQLQPHAGQAVLLAVSPGGSVRLARATEETAVPDESATGSATLIRSDLAKLDLADRRLRTLSELRGGDSGRSVGPKAAQLGELRHHYPEAVAEGLAIPFGVFRDVLDGTRTGQGEPLWDWMVANYRALEALPADSAQRRQRTEEFRAALYDAVLNAPLAPAFGAELAARLAQAFGPDGSYGVFVRSDTNVEDLPGFTGAGLNLTVPNVVGTGNILAAISRVWASPFTARAFAWRQTHMADPEHVYPAVLLMRSVDVDKSGVLVTQDIDTGDPRWLSVAVNEGVGGAVDGQSAESLRIDTATGAVRLLAQATTPWRRKVDLSGGVRQLPVSGEDAVLKPGEIARLIEFARDLPQRFPPITDAEGRPAPADVEFGFLGGELRLFQIRPFLDSAQARGSAPLRAMDQRLADPNTIAVDMTAPPQGEP